jgi:DNA-binding response OmpR family regulator
MTRERLLEKNLGKPTIMAMRGVIDVHVGHIRQKLGRPEWIATVRGVGYRFEDERA